MNSCGCDEIPKIFHIFVRLQHCEEYDNMMHNRHIIRIGTILLAAVGLSSCFKVNGDYDLDNGLDTEMRFGGEMALPLGNSAPLTLGEIVDVDKSDFIRVNDNGDYSAWFAKTYSWNLDVPKFDIDPGTSGIWGDSGVIKIPTWLFEMTEAFPFAINNEIFIEQTDAPEEILELDEATGEMMVTVELQYEQNPEVFSAIHFSPGLRVTFPDYITLKNSLDYRFKVVEHNVMETTDEMMMSNGSLMRANCTIGHIDFTAMPEGQGLVEVGHIIIDDIIRVEGKARFAKIYQTDNTAESLNLNVKSEIKCASMRVNDAVGRVHISRKADFAPLPIIFDNKSKLKGSVLNFSDPRVWIGVTNNFPLGALISGDLSAYAGLERTAKISFNEESGNIISVPGEQSSLFRFAGHGPGGDDCINIIDPEFSKLFTRLPDVLTVDNFFIESTTEKTHFKPRDRYTIDLDCALEVPLAFEDGMKVTWNVDFKDPISLGGARFTSADIDATVESTLPFEVEIGTTLDPEQNAGRTIETSCLLAPGTMEKPSESPISIKIRFDEPTGSITGISLDLKLRCSDPAFAGINLNEKHGIRIKDAHLEIHDGIIL